MPLVFKRIIFISYLVGIAIMAVFPFSAADLGAMNKVYVLSFRLDHLLHVVAFVPLYPLGAWLFQPVSWKDRVYLLFWGLLIAFAAEFVQYFIAFRAYNPADLISNLAGVVVGAIVYFGYSSLVVPRRN
jgi:glycopeptide antibiotics resistance protein